MNRICKSAGHSFHLVNRVNPVDILPNLFSAINRGFQFTKHQRQIFRLVVGIQAAGIG
jgi:hypothetical protein